MHLRADPLTFAPKLREIAAQRSTPRCREEQPAPALLARAPGVLGSARPATGYRLLASSYRTS